MTWWIAALIAAVLITVAQLLEKKYLDRMHTLVFSTELSLYGFFLSLALIPWVRWDFGHDEYFLLVAIGALWTGVFFFANKAIRHSAVSEIVPLGNLKVIVTLFMAMIILGDIPTMWHLVGVLMVVAGAYSLLLHPKHSFFEPFTLFRSKKSTTYVLLSVILYGVLAVLVKLLLITVPVVTFLFFLNVLLFAGYLLLDYFTRHSDNILQIRPRLSEHGRGIFFAALALFLARIFIFMAFQSGSVTLASAVLELSVFFTIIAAGRILHEQNLARKLIASAVMIAGTLFIIS